MMTRFLDRRRRADGPHPAQPHAPRCRRAADRPSARGQAHGLRAGGVSRARAHDVLSALVDDRPGGGRFLLRARDAVQRDGAAVQRGQAARHGFLPGLRRARQRRAARIRHFNTSILVERDGTIVGKYRKVHLPGHAEHEPERPFQHLEKRYFEVGNLGFPVVKAFGGNIGMCICNDRRWPETYRVMGLQGVEMVLLGYNTPLHNAPSPDHDEHSWFHNQLSMQAGAYQNGTWVVGVAKGGSEEGVPSLADSMIVAPSGKVVARAGRRRRRADRPSLRSRRRPELQAHDLQLRRSIASPTSTA